MCNLLHITFLAPRILTWPLDFWETFFTPVQKTFTRSHFHFLFIVEWVTSQVWLQWPTVTSSLKLRSSASSKYWVDWHDHHNSNTRRCCCTTPWHATPTEKFFFLPKIGCPNNKKVNPFWRNFTTPFFLVQMLINLYQVLRRNIREDCSSWSQGSRFVITATTKYRTSQLSCVSLQCLGLPGSTCSPTAGYLE
jgi:hypothetical protein